MYKIRLTDSVTLKKFVILKPEVEKEFQDGYDEGFAVDETQETLDFAINRQLETIVGRMSKKDMLDTLRDASVDPRFINLIKREIDNGQ